MSSNCPRQEVQPDLRSFRVLYLNTDGRTLDRDTTENLANSDYEELQNGQIRLLTLHSPSEFTLEKAYLTDDLQYVAASYCWGDIGDLYDARINGYGVQLRQHVYAMLGELYRTHHVTQVWLDMICINQSNENEKSKQVRLMGDIYGKAVRVYAWLGGADPKIDLVFDVLCGFRDRKNGVPYPDHLGLVEQLSHHRELFFDIWQEKANNIPEKSELDDDLLHEELNWLRPLFIRPYWTRVWIMQELILAKEVLICCGKMSIRFDDIYGLSADWGSYEQSFDLGSHRLLKPKSIGWFTIQTVRGHRQRRDPRNAIASLTGLPLSEMEHGAMLNEVVEVYAKNQHCRCAKDKVYGFLELVPRWRKLDVSYEQSDEEVFLDVAKLGLFKAEGGGGWYVAHTLWSAMSLGGYQDFLHCIREAMPEVYHQNSRYHERSPRMEPHPPVWTEEDARRIFTKYRTSFWRSK